MNLQNISDEEKTLVARIRDYVSKCENSSTVVYTDFLSDRERAIALEVARSMGVEESVMTFGGYDDSERSIIAFLPDYAQYLDSEELIADFPIVALKVKCSGFLEHNHRDYLGSILGLGIKRSVIGDIIVGEKGYDGIVFVHERIAEFILENFKMIGRDSITLSMCTSADKLSLKRSYEVIKCTSASLRLDAVISEVLNLSREKAQTLIDSGLVSVNHEEMTERDRSRMLSASDVFTARGYGKFVLSSIGDKNRKDRIRFEVWKYI